MRFGLFTLLVVMIGSALLAVFYVRPVDAQSWRQSDPSAIVLPGQDNQVRRDRRGGGGGLFRIFRFEPQRQTRRVLPPLEEPVVTLPPPKDPDAIAVVVLGDEFADQMREGLIDRFDGDRLVEAVGVSIPGSGLTDMTSVNWNVEAIQRLEDYTQVGAVVVAIGYSDRRPLVEGERRFAFASPDWRQQYRNRVSGLALTLLAEGHSVLFVGLPPMASPAMNDEVQLINQVIEEAVAPTRARFVSVYSGFADVEGRYTRAGPNMAGQVENLRTSDGIFFNRAGREKFAHFVERFIPRDGQTSVEPEVSDVIFEGSTLAADGIGPVVLMTSGFADPTAVLARDASEVLPEEPDVRARLLRGTVNPAPVGRADHFVWTQPEG